MLGGLRLTVGAQTTTRFRTQKTAALLAYLACHPERAHAREVLVELLWPEDDPESGRHKLSVALSALRQQLEPPGGPDGAVLVTERAAVRLSPGAVVTDLAEFERALQAADRASAPDDRVPALVQAVDLYRGELLAGCYEDWALAEQRRLEEQFLGAIRQLVADLEQQGDLERAIQYAVRAVGIDHLREEAHAELMRLFAAAGRPGAALRAYEELGALVREEYDRPPSPRTEALAAEIRRAGAEASELQARQLPRGAEVEDSRAPRNGSRPPAGSPGASRGTAASGSSDVGARDHVSGAVQPLPFVEPVGGAVPLGSSFYLVRGTDAEFQSAITRGDSIVLVKGPAQVGKTSLLARGLQAARSQGTRVAHTDIQIFNAAQLASASTLLLAFAESLADELGLEPPPARAADSLGGPNVAFQRYLRRAVLARSEERVVWGLDGVDRLFGCDFGPEIFALLRAGHNERALDPEGPWSRLTLALASATEAHLFISDLNQSPFNVGTRLLLDDFTREEVAKLNRRCGSPLSRDGDVERFYQLVGGHPYLVRRGLHELAARRVDLAVLERTAGWGEGIFGDHLHRLLGSLSRDPDLCQALRGVLEGRHFADGRAFYRLRSAGVLAGEDPARPRLRCGLYATFLEQSLPPAAGEGDA